jgi:cell wall-associated NlpC family hydrolase
VFLAFKDLLGVELPSYVDDYMNAADEDEIAALMDSEQTSTPDWIPVADRRPFDLLRLRAGSRGAHCGIFVKPPMFLHTLDDGIKSRIDDASRMSWNHRIEGVLRHRSRI